MVLRHTNVKAIYSVNSKFHLHQTLQLLMFKKGTPICLSQKSSPRNFLSLKVQVWIYHWNPESYSKFTSAEQRSDPNINWFLESLCLAIKKRLLDANSAVFRQNTWRLVREQTWMVFSKTELLSKVCQELYMLGMEKWNIAKLNHSLYQRLHLNIRMVCKN